MYQTDPKLLKTYLYISLKIDKSIFVLKRKQESYGFSHFHTFVSFQFMTRAILLS